MYDSWTSLCSTYLKRSPDTEWALVKTAWHACNCMCMYTCICNTFTIMYVRIFVCVMHGAQDLRIHRSIHIHTMCINLYIYVYIYIHVRSILHTQRKRACKLLRGDRDNGFHTSIHIHTIHINLFVCIHMFSHICAVFYIAEKGMCALTGGSGHSHSHDHQHGALHTHQWVKISCDKL